MRKNLLLKIGKHFSFLALSVILITTSGCFGKFALVRKLYAFNDGLEGKFVKSLVFWVLGIIPVYGVAGFIDIFILNVIEFWSGSNPVAMNDGDHEVQVVKVSGKKYRIIATKNQFEVVQLFGKRKSTFLKYNSTEQNWTYVDGNTSRKIIQMFEESGQIAAQYLDARGNVVAAVSAADIQKNHEMAVAKRESLAVVAAK